MIVIGDVHVGNHRLHGGAMRSGLNDRCQEVLNVLGQVFNDSHPEQRAIVIAGDLLDSRRAEPQVIAAVQQIFQGRNPQQPVYLLLGNHERCSSETMDHALAPFANMDNVWVIEKTTCIDQVLFVPYAPCEDGAAYLRGEIAKAEMGQGIPEDPVLVGHMGIWDSQTVKPLQGLPGSIRAGELLKICGEAGIRQAFMGDWHRHRQWFSGSTTITQIGALVPTGWDNPSDTKGHVGDPQQDPYGSVVYATVEESSRQSFRGPRFVEATSTVSIDAFVSAAAKRGIPHLYVRARCAPAAVPAIQEHISGFSVLDPEHPDAPPELRCRNTKLSFEILPDAAQDQAALEDAVKRVTATDRLEVAVAEYVAGMPLADGVDRGAVLACVRDSMEQG